MSSTERTFMFGRKSRASRTSQEQTSAQSAPIPAQEEHTSHPEGTPHILDIRTVSAPLVNIVLFERTPGPEEIVEQLQQQFENELGEFQINPETNSVAVEVWGDHLIHVTTVEAVPDGEYFHMRYHPVLSGEESAVDNVTTQVVVALLPSEGRMQLNKQLIEPRMNSAFTHAAVTEAVASVDGALLVHSTLAEVTFNAGYYRGFVQEGRVEEALVSVWIVQSENGGSNAYTCGLAPLGHPELIFVDSPIPPEELYAKLMNLANYILNGAVLRPEDTLGFADDQILRVSEGTHPYFADVACLELQITEA
ncbi:DUF4261 domain-containing protein [Corynebacterium auriscanis]|uniref:DUF4261 domain-containing protein n=1 Tax=Corynebacterium auriscanis TaxID=99807 RepID=UPI003CE8D702